MNVQMFPCDSDLLVLLSNFVHCMKKLPAEAAASTFMRFTKPSQKYKKFIYFLNCESNFVLVFIKHTKYIITKILNDDEI